jgi:hypothetical protein
MQHGPAASSGSNPKAPGSAGGYLLFQTYRHLLHVRSIITTTILSLSRSNKKCECKSIYSTARDGEAMQADGLEVGRSNKNPHDRQPARGAEFASAEPRRPSGGAFVMRVVGRGAEVYITANCAHRDRHSLPYPCRAIRSPWNIPPAPS